ncbi:FtsX-like permease family protein [Streptomyces sp. NPDC048595]|uniref:FtsX-like permease family protein n=1 Tax=Streptomyces sp. NPDC048595 TaxID=3365576 RepID=UPI00371DD621
MSTPMPPDRSRPDRGRGAGPRRWCTDLALGARFALTGGREGLLRTALTALGVGLGVFVLLLAAAVPQVLHAAVDRKAARAVVPAAEGTGPSDRTLLTAELHGAFHDRALGGRLVQPEGTRAPVPPGLSRLPGPGELAVSPALAELLASPDGALLKERFAHLRVTARIGDEGLTHPAELSYYQGSDRLRGPGAGVERITAFGDRGTPFRASPLVALAITTGCVALLAPVAVFIATAVRFGGDRRDRRLAALRLVGADVRTTRRIAAGETLTSALLGLLGGAALLLAVRVPLSSLTLFGLGVFPSDVVPDPVLAAVIALAVPLCAVAVTLLTLRRVTVEPLGVTRTAPPLRRRLWWRALLPAAGVALLLPQAAGGLRSGDAAGAQLILGTALLLLGIAALLPWLLDATVARLGRARFGGQAWQLAVRRLQSSSAAASRSVSGITVAVAGAVAVQLLLAGVWTGLGAPSATTPWTEVTAREGTLPADRAPGMSARLSATPGVLATRTLVTGYADTYRPQHQRSDAGTSADAASEPYPFTVADCATLRAQAHIGACSDGDVFLAGGPDGGGPRPGERLALEPSLGPTDHRASAVWTVPAAARRTTVADRGTPLGLPTPTVLATPKALPPTLLHRPTLTVLVRPAPGDPDALERLRNTAAHIDARTEVSVYRSAAPDETLDLTRRALTAGAVAVLLLIGCGLLITAVEQLRERARLLSALDALGTPRGVLARSLLWQTALPVALGLALALTCGLALGSLLLHMAGRPLLPDWWGILTLTATAAAVILTVTALSLPLLWRLMRPEGLRTE